MKGIILTAGAGTRLLPLTKTLNKQLLPVYDKPVIYFPLATLMLADISDILIITSPQHLHEFKALLGDGSQWGISLSYAIQAQAKGIAEAFLIAEEFIADDDTCLILGDNIFHGNDLQNQLLTAKRDFEHCYLFSHFVEQPSAFGIIEFDESLNAISIEEKPTQPKSNTAVTGLYFYDNSVIDMAKSLQPSARGELEITDINKCYLNKKQLKIMPLDEEIRWFDIGTPQSLLAAGNYVEMTEQQQGKKIACLEEIAWNMSYINDEQLLNLAQQAETKDQGKYLASLLPSTSAS